MKIIINRVDSGHPAFIELIEILNQELWDRNPGRQEEYVAYNILDDGTHAVVAFDQNLPVASGAFRNFNNGTAEIKRMFVRKEFRGNGISKLVLKELESWAKEEGVNRTILETGLNHPESISLYKKSGYLRTKNYGPYANMPQSICMEKKLISI